MRALVFPSDMTACGHYRLRWSVQALAAQGADVIVGDHVPAQWRQTALGPRLHAVARLDADVAVFQRVFRPDLLALIAAVREQGVAIVIDVDDDFMALGPRHPAYDELHPATPGKSWAVLREALRLADVVTVSTPALAAKYRGVVIPNCVPSAYLDIRRTETHDKPVIGWTGTPAMHPGDLEVVDMAIRDVCASGARFRAIGDRATLGVLGVPEQEHQPGLSLASFDYARAVAQLDVGIAPLTESAFCRAKSWLKPLEYSALGVPWIASDLPEYRRLHELGAGVIVRRPREWARELQRLSASPDLRLVLGAQGRAMASTLTIEDTQAPLVWDAWRQALTRRKISVNGSPLHPAGLHPPAHGTRVVREALSALVPDQR